MRKTRRHFLQGAGALAALSSFDIALAQSGLLEHGRILVGFPAGGGTDGAARRIADGIRGHHANIVVVENKPGAAGRLAVEEVRRNVVDGSVMLVQPDAVMTQQSHVDPKNTRYKFDDLSPEPASVCTTMPWWWEPWCPTRCARFGSSWNGPRQIPSWLLSGRQSYRVWGERVRLPDNVSYNEAARFGYLGTMYSALRKGGVGPGSTVLINGISGTLGIGGALLALAMGAARPRYGTQQGVAGPRKALAPKRIDVLSHANGEAIDAWAKERTNGLGVDVYIDALSPGAPQESVQQGMASLKRSGRPRLQHRCCRRPVGHEPVHHDGQLVSRFCSMAERHQRSL